ncbi:glycosyltransferase family 2 protein [Helicobacter sp. MIT 05-5293]|uniref:glycosyltransferase family 2 protein n=1 Tax=Helicobacter sp. MIT 05-5293 TaxID=1548149 RepID=UPI0010FF618B|nr:glycosyltransferase family 2 protein [Helicobacter sp. MIT 05-5293]TLD82019.1 glycosyltransferase family 2 protein [Helicobacter sp. MIT 05-5293]
MDKLVSVVLPTYNGEKWLAQSIESVLNQTYKNLELIIVNDCSSDNTPTIIESFAKVDSRVKIIHNATNQKLPKSLNIGFDVARGDYYTWTSDDNYYELNAIEEMVSYLEKNTHKILVCSDYMRIFTEEGKTKRTLVSEKIEDIISYDCIGACFLYRAEIAKALGGYSEEKFKVEDYDYFLKMGLKGEFGTIHQILYTYRSHKDSLSGTQAKNEVAIKTEQLLREYLPLYLDKYHNLNIDTDIRLKARALAITNSYSELNKLCQETKQKRYIYRTLRFMYIATKDTKILDSIMQLGIIYRIKFWIYCKSRNIS